VVFWEGVQTGSARNGQQSVVSHTLQSVVGHTLQSVVGHTPQLVVGHTPPVDDMDLMKGGQFNHLKVGSWNASL